MLTGTTDRSTGSAPRRTRISLNRKSHSRPGCRHLVTCCSAERIIAPGVLGVAVCGKPNSKCLGQKRGTAYDYLVRGPDHQQSAMFSYLSPEQRVPRNHPLRAIRQITDTVFKQLSHLFSEIYSQPANTPQPSLKNKAGVSRGRVAGLRGKPEERFWKFPYVLPVAPTLRRKSVSARLS